MSEGVPRSDSSTLAQDRARTPFVQFLRSAGRLAIARQAAAVALLLAVLALPALASRAVTTDFVWTYFAMLTLTSLFGFGLERLAGVVTAARGDASVAAAIGPLVLVRLIAAPLVPIGMWVLFAFVGVSIPPLAWVATFVWVMAGLLEPVVFGAVRAAGDNTTEPVVMVAVRVAQAVSLVALGAAGAAVSTLTAVVALYELLGTVVAFRRAGPLGDLRCGLESLRSLPHRQAGALVGIDVLTLCNVRADLLLVGRILGPVSGAAYGLAYRAVDGFNGLAGSVGLWMYAESVNERDGATSPEGIRARSLALLPKLGVGFALVVVLLAGFAADLVPQLAGDVTTIRVLATAFPLITLNAIEAHVRSGRGRNKEMLGICIATLVVKVPLCVFLILQYGLVGAAAALTAAELLESALLAFSASTEERGLLARPMAVAVGGSSALVLVTAALAAGRIDAAVAATILVLAIVLWPGRRRQATSAATT